jgi:hypothetical protein
MAVQINPDTFGKRVKLLYNGWKVCNAAASTLHTCTAQHGRLNISQVLFAGEPGRHLGQCKRPGSGCGWHQ